MSCCIFDDLELVSEIIDGLWNKFRRWMEAFESKGLKDKFGKTKVMLSGGNRKDCLSRSKVDT